MTKTNRLRKGTVLNVARVILVAHSVAYLIPAEMLEKTCNDVDKGFKTNLIISLIGFSVTVRPKAFAMKYKLIHKI